MLKFSQFIAETAVPHEWKGKKIEHTLDKSKLVSGIFNSKDYEAHGLEYVPTHQLNWTQNRIDHQYVKGLEDKLKKHGMTKAVVAREMDGKLHVADGHHHLQSMQNQGHKTIPTVILRSTHKD